MYIHSLYSSSSGNSMKISTDTTCILIDAGVSFKKLCEASGDKFESLDAIFITHDHGDHVGGAGVLGRKTGAPIFIHEKSYGAREKLFKNCDIEHIFAGDEIQIGDLLISCFSNKHDAQYCLSYIITDTNTGKKFGYTTDTGMITPMMADKLKGCDAYLLEANYDPKMMEDYDGYDQIHKDRVTSSVGHLSNEQTIEFIKNNLDLDDVEFILFGHMSPRTNSPDILMPKVESEFPGYMEKFALAPTETFRTL